MWKYALGDKPLKNVYIALAYINDIKEMNTDIASLRKSAQRSFT